MTPNECISAEEGQGVTRTLPRQHTRITASWLTSSRSTRPGMAVGILKNEDGERRRMAGQDVGQQ